MKTYTVILRDTTGCELYRTECEGLRAAKDKARYIATEEFVRHVECDADYTHAQWGSDRVEVTDDGDYVVFDLPVAIGVAK